MTRVVVVNNGYCVICERMYPAPAIEDGICQTCQDSFSKNEPPTCDAEVYQRPLSKAAMRERLGVSRDVDE